MAGSKSSGKIYDFLMSIHYGLCYGPVDNLNKVWVKDKPVMCGTYPGRADQDVSLPELFGGDDGEGGVSGVIEYYNGADDQVSSASLAARVGRTPETMPGYRGLASLFFRGRGGAGWRWTSNNPYLPGVKASVSRFPKVLNPLYSQIFPNVPSDGTEDDSSYLTYETTEIPMFTQGDNGTYQASVTAEQARDWFVRRARFDTVSADVRFVDNQFEGLGLASPGYLRIERWFNLSDLGLTNEKVDAGTARVNGTILAQSQINGSTDEADVDLVTVRVDTFSDFQLVGDYPTGTSTFGGDTDVSGGFYGVFDTVLPPGTRWLRIQFDTSDVGACRTSNLFVSSQTMAEVFCGDDDNGLRGLPNANPAHIIYEALTDAEWGMGESSDNIDTASFEYAAQLFFEEGFGLSLIWVRQASIQDFVQQVLDHASAMLFIHPRTGLWTLRPLRGDYVVADVLAGRRLTPANCEARKGKRRAWGETVNEIVVRYTDPATEEDATVSAQDLANITIQGGVISQTREYPGVRDPVLAQRVAERDVAQEGYPLYSCEIIADRQFWDVVPGDVLAFSYPEHEVEDMIVRVTKVSPGSNTERAIRIQVVEDIFSVARAAYGARQGSEWSDPAVSPEPLAPFERQFALTAPLPLLTRENYTVDEIDANFPSVGVMLFGGDETGAASNITVVRDIIRADGSLGYGPVGTIPNSRARALPAALAEEAVSTVSDSFVQEVTLGGAQPGDLFIINNDFGGYGAALDAEGHEIVMLGDYDSATDTWNLLRGIWDTVPQPWPGGDGFLDTGLLWPVFDFGGQSDPAERVPGEPLSYRLLPRTSRGQLSPGAATPMAFRPDERPHRPFRPADCQIDGNGFAPAIFPGGFPDGGVPVSWSNRNRTTEDQVARRWTDGNVAPEAGQTTVIVVLDGDPGEPWAASPVNEITGLTGSNYNVNFGAFSGLQRGYLQFFSERDGLRSLQGAMRYFDFS